MTKDPWYVYILLCSDHYLYTGIALNVKKRVLTHRQGKGAKFTKSKSPIILMYIEKQENHTSAMRREREIKQMQKKKKLSLIDSFQSTIPMLSDPIIIDFLTVNIV